MIKAGQVAKTMTQDYLTKKAAQAMIEAMRHAQPQKPVAGAAKAMTEA